MSLFLFSKIICYPSPGFNCVHGFSAVLYPEGGCIPWESFIPTTSEFFHYLAVAMHKLGSFKTTPQRLFQENTVAQYKNTECSLNSSQ